MDGRVSTASGPAETRLLLSLPDIHCAGCIAGVERALNAMPHVRDARVNLTLRRASVNVNAGTDARELAQTLTSLGYRAYELDSETLDGSVAARADRDLRERGYRSAGEWAAFQPFEQPIDGSPLEGGCGVFLIQAVGSSVIEGRMDDGTKTYNTCDPRLLAVASCGEDVTIAGLGEFRARPYLMPNMGPLEGLPVEHLLAHAEAEHLVASHGLEAAPHVLWPDAPQDVPPPPTGCSTIISTALPTSATASAPSTEPRFVVDQHCAGHVALPVNTQLVLRAFSPFRGAGAPRTDILRGSALHRNDADFPPLTGD